MSGLLLCFNQHTIQSSSNFEIDRGTNMGCVSCFLLWTAIILVVFKLYVKLTTGWCRSNVCLVGKTAIVTGGNTGIGYQTAEDLAKRGARVILACRDPSRGKDAEEKIIKATDNKNVVFKQLDLSSLKSVREFAEDINATEQRLDILVNNAGAGGFGKRRSEDGLLLIMQTNYFGHFLLTNLLLDLIKKTPNSRIVNVSSLMAKYVRSFDINHLNSYPEEISLPDWEVYARTKLCNLLFTIELANRLKGTSVTSYSLHPGAILTDIFRKVPAFTKFLIEQVLSWFFKNPLEGAQTSIYCSVTKGIEHLSGEHFVDCHEVSRYKTAMDPDLPRQLWSVSEDIVQLKSK